MERPIESLEGSTLGVCMEGKAVVNNYYSYYLSNDLRESYDAFVFWAAVFG
jgi:hypothetical protein